MFTFLYFVSSTTIVVIMAVVIKVFIVLDERKRKDGMTEKERITEVKETTTQKIDEWKESTNC